MEKSAAQLNLQLSLPCISSKEAFQARFVSAKQCLFPQKRSIDNYRLLSRLLDAVDEGHELGGIAQPEEPNPQFHC